VAKQLLEYLIREKLLPELQSAYRAFHSTETAVLKVLSDILLAVDQGDLAMLTLSICLQHSTPLTMQYLAAPS